MKRKNIEYVGSTKTFFIIIIVLFLVGLGLYFRQHNKAEAPILGGEQGEFVMTSQINAFFPNSKFAGSFKGCDLVFGVEKQVTYSENVVELAKSALTETIKGPTQEEEALGYSSLSIPSSTKINSLTVGEDGLLKVDLSKDVENGGGSCAQTAKLSAIRQTLLQFPAVSEVQISVDGNAKEDQIFQP